MKYHLLFIVTFFILWGTSSVYSQYEEIKEVKMFGSRMENPIKVNGQLKDNEGVIFFAENRSSYPYVVELKFNTLSNLVPYASIHKEVVFPGKHKLISFSIQDPEKGIDYNYSVKYYLGGLSNEPDYKFPYLFPLTPGKQVIAYKKNPKSSTYLINHFNMDFGDTICCMRKGYVTAVPQMNHKGDRISSKKSVEIMHKDGTVMVYENIDSGKQLIKLGQTLYPGQAVGCVDNRKYLRVYLVSLTGKGNIKSNPFFYVDENNNAKHFDNSFLNSKVVHPKEIVMKEMTKREVKKIKKGKIIL